MELDDEICLCFHVTKRKVQNFLRVERPRRASQLSECFGAGTGCGWCRPYLEQLYRHAQATDSSAELLPGADQYAQQRADYIEQGGGTPPPGATPVEESSRED